MDVRGRLTAADLPALVQRLGFRDDDRAEVLAAAATVLASEPDLAVVATLADRLRARIGDFSFDDTDNPLELPGSDPARLGVGVLPLLALVATAVDVAEFHRRRGIAADISWASLADLGQQAWVHRQTFGGFGLHTYGWMRIAWAGALHWLGRLQFNLQREDDGWVLSTHIPATGPLSPAAVDASFTLARAFFARHFPDYPTSDFYCASWLLDPELAAAVRPDSNLARFQRRWRLYGYPRRGDEDALFFTFFRRGEVDLATLPRDTTLQRAIVDRLRSGRHWNAWQGRIPQEHSTSGDRSPGDRPSGDRSPGDRSPGDNDEGPGSGPVRNRS